MKLIEIELPPIALNARVRIDGQEISHYVTRIVVDASAGRPTEVTLTLVGPLKIRAEVNDEALQLIPGEINAADS